MPENRVTQIPVELLISAARARTTQAPVENLLAASTTSARATQVVVEMLFLEYGEPIPVNYDSGLIMCGGMVIS